jgi:paraquat-inducible protein B
MSKKANPTLIGVFIAVALLLAVGGILIFSSSRFFTPVSEYILYFDASINGLDAGAPVKFRGVTIGAVKEVLIHHNQQPSDSSLPVIIEINEDLLKSKADVPLGATEANRIKAEIQRGLRARLETQSLLTGLLYVNLEFLPDIPIRYHQLKPTREEIPTAPNQIQVFIDDFAQIAQKLNLVLGKLDVSLGELHIKELSHGLTNLMASLTTFTSSPELTNTLSAAHQTLDEFRLFLNELRPELQQLAESADRTLTESSDTLGVVRDGVQDLREVLAPRGPLRRELTITLEELAEAARSVATLAEFLNQHPNALLSGRRAAESKP